MLQVASALHPSRMGNGTWIIELCRAKSWRELTEDEKEIFEKWLEGATAHDLFMLVNYGLNFEATSNLAKVRSTSSKPPSEDA